MCTSRVSDRIDWLTSEEMHMLGHIRKRKTELLNEIQQLKDEIANVTAELTNLKTVNEYDSRVTMRTKQMTIGKKRFNMDPKKGIEYLVEHQLLANTPESIALFLMEGEGLNKTAIGDYLGERSEFNMKVLDTFVNLHNFSNLILVQALRQFLWSFRLPGEAQKIDRMMEKFAIRYCQQNPGVFNDTDTCFVLSFAVIMLNTSLHNPSVKDKPTLEKFITMNRGIDNGQDLPRQLLESLYESIKQEPFKIPEEDGNDLMLTFFNPDREGWLWKQGGVYRGWKRRWFILNDKCLYYFEYTTDKEPRGIIPLENVQVEDIPDSRASKPNTFELHSALGPGEVIKACKTDADGKVIEGRHTRYRMSASTTEEKEQWIKSIRSAISLNPFYDMNCDRKLHPHRIEREYQRALNATKLERVFAKPYIGNLSGHGDIVNCLMKHQTKLSVIVSGACDGQIKIWNLASRRCVRTIEAHNSVVRSLCISRLNENHFFSVDSQSTIKKWRYFGEDQVIIRKKPLKAATSHQQVDSDDSDLDSSDDMGEDVNYNQTLQDNDIPIDTVIAKSLIVGMDHHYKRPFFVTVGDKVDLWEETRNEPLRSWSWGADSSQYVKFNPIEVDICAATSNDRGITLYDTRKANPMRKIVLEMRSNQVCWNPMEAFVFTAANEDHDLYTFDMRNLNKPLIIHKDHTEAVITLDYSPTGLELVSGSYDKTIRIFNAREGRSRDVYHTKRMQKLTDVAWTHDGKYIISASDEMDIRLWRARASEKIGPKMFREERATNVQETLKKKFANHPEIKRISRHRHVPRHVYHARKEKREMLDSRKRKEANRRAHSRPGTIAYVPEKRRHIFFRYQQTNNPSKLEETDLRRAIIASIEEHCFDGAILNSRNHSDYDQQDKTASTGARNSSPASLASEKTSSAKQTTNNSTHACISSHQLNNEADNNDGNNNHSTNTTSRLCKHKLPYNSSPFNTSQAKIFNDHKKHKGTTQELFPKKRPRPEDFLTYLCLPDPPKDPDDYETNGESYTDDDESIVRGEKPLPTRDGAPLNMAPRDKYNNIEYWPDGFGNMTNAGRLRMFNLGKFLRSRYSTFLSDNFREVYSRSSDVDRCIESSQAVMAGMYPPTERLSWNPDLPWTPTPVHSVPPPEDYLLNEGGCDVVKQIAKEIIKVQTLDEVKKLYEESEADRILLVNEYGYDFDSFVKFKCVYSTLDIEYRNGMDMPEWYTPEMRDRLYKYAGLCFALAGGGTDTLKRIHNGHLLHDIISRMEIASANRKVHSKSEFQQPTNEPEPVDDKKVVHYSTHDSIIAAVLEGLNISRPDPVPPGFGSTIFFELYLADKSDPRAQKYVKILYLDDTESERPIEKVLPGCKLDDQGLLTLENFKAHLKNLLPQ
ncbi:Cytohesin-1 [Fragariocoptes setiger]|uniref:DDB1- and CUL4-associated factor 13 n=1 Tax=Fragariocoptes setiger TaxID=1670756 RepID=A0ABQ7S7L7_9ACAR|nr:Cytohesin-1 [Fragariocoptes setiger]